MKKRIFAILMALLMLSYSFVALVGCNSDTDATRSTTKGTAEKPAQTSGTTQSTKPTQSVKPTDKPSNDQSADNNEDVGNDDGKGETEEVFDPNIFDIFANQKYYCAIVLPKNATVTEKEIAKKIEEALTAKTGAAITVLDDTQKIDGYRNVILVGNTSYDESKEVYSSLAKGSATAVVRDKKLVIAFSGFSDGVELSNSFATELAKSENGTARLSVEYTYSCNSLTTDGSMPEFKYATSIIDCEDSTVMKYFSGATAEEFECYCAELENAKFKQSSEREVEGNLFATYVKGEQYVYLYYTAFSKDIRLFIGPKSSLAQTDYTTGGKTNVDPYITSIPQSDAGQGYILRLPDGRYIIQDGGYEGADRVYNRLRDLQPKGDIVIAAWFISHPHGDHYPAFIDFIRDHGKDTTITIERLIYSYAHHSRYSINGTAGLDESALSVLELYAAVEEYMPELSMIRAHTGQIMDFGSATVEILFTVEDIVPAALTNVNDSSMVIRVEMGGSYIMLLADTSYTSGPKLNNMWGSYLKSDMVQVAHHGMWPSVPELYHNIKAEVVLYSTMYYHLKYHIKDTTDWAATTAAVLEYAVDIYVSDAGYDVIMLPYTPKNNKNEMLEYIKSR